MSTRTNPADEIIELTEIVEEEMPVDVNPAPPAANADDAILDLELDDLLREDAPPAQGAERGKDLDMEALFGSQPASGAGQTEASMDLGASSLDNDLADLEDLFESLKTTPVQDAPTALDEFLGTVPEFEEAPKTAAQPVPVASPANLGLDLDLPGLDAKHEAEVQPLDLSEDLVLELTDIAETPVETNEISSPPDSVSTAAPESTERDAMPAPAPVFEAPSSTPAPRAVAPEMAQAGLEVLTTRLDALEAKAASAQPDIDRILAALPAELERLPFALPLCETILAEVDTKLAAQGSGPDMTAVRHDVAALEAKLAAMDQTCAVDDLRQGLTAATERLTALEARPMPEPMSTEQILAAIPTDPDHLPATASLRQGIAALEAKLAAMDQTSAVDALRQGLTAATERLTALEARPMPEPMSTEQILAAIPTDPDQLPATASLRQDIAALEAKFAAMDQTSAVDDLRQDLTAAAERLSALEARPMPEPMSAELILAAIPTDPDHLPATASLRQDIAALETKLAAMDQTSAVDELRQDLTAATERLRALEARPMPEPMPAELILAAIPTDPDHLPATASLRHDIAALEAKLAAMDQTSAVDELRQDLRTLRASVDDVSAALRKMAAIDNATQAQGREVEALRTATQSQEEALRALRADVARKDDELSSLREAVQDLRQTVSTFSRESSESSEHLKAELQGFVRDQVPAAAAKIIREEIANLLKELEG